MFIEVEQMSPGQMSPGQILPGQLLPGQMSLCLLSVMIKTNNPIGLSTAMLYASNPTLWLSLGFDNISFKTENFTFALLS